MHFEFEFRARMNYSPLKSKEEFSAQSFRLFTLALSQLEEALVRYILRRALRVFGCIK